MISLPLIVWCTISRIFNNKLKGLRNIVLIPASQNFDLQYTDCGDGTFLFELRAFGRAQPNFFCMISLVTTIQWMIDKRVRRGIYFSNGR